MLSLRHSSGLGLLVKREKFHTHTLCLLLCQPSPNCTLRPGHTTIRQAPSRLTRRLWALSHARTAWLTCHEALSHTINSAVFPSAINRSVSQPRNCVVTALTGRPSTKRRNMPCVSARHSP